MIKGAYSPVSSRSSKASSGRRHRWRLADSRRWRGVLWQDMAVAALLTAMSLVLFRSHVLGDGLYIGNPDRLNSNLKILKFYVDGLSRGHLDAWSHYEMLGYDSFTLPYTFPSAFPYLVAWLGAERMYVVAGYELVVLLALAGIAAYAFLRALVTSVFPAAIGAILYQFSALTILKISQNDLSFAVFILIPVMMLIIHGMTSQNTRRSFILLAPLVFLLLHFTFLQKASYALLLGGAYALYRTILAREWRIAMVFGAACVVALVGAFPRLYGIALAIKEYARVVAGVDFDRFADVYRFQGVRPSQILRWFDGGIFGRFPSEAVVTLGNNINVTEGFLLYTSSLVPFLVILGALGYGRGRLGILRSTRNDAAFFFWVLVFTVAVVAVPLVLHLVWLFYLRMDFTHARILIAGLLALSVLVSLVLVDISPQNKPVGQNQFLLALFACLTAVLLVAGIEIAARSVSGQFLMSLPYASMHVLTSAVVRIVLSGVVVIGLLWVIKGRVLGLSTRRSAACAKEHAASTRVMYWALGLAIGLHTFLGADFQVNGPHTWASPPMQTGNIYYSSRENFHPPSPEAIAALRGRLENDSYRSVLICDPDVAGGFCAGHVPEFWQLRVVDGYYGLGVPRRLVVLPWASGVSLRTVSFTDVKSVPWPILSLLNVKYALRVKSGLFNNNGARPDEARQPVSESDFEVIDNPLPAVPRYFFARSTMQVATPEEAAARLFENGVLQDVTQMSMVENLDGARQFSGAGVISTEGTGDHLTLTVDRAENERFLVANELYFPGWTARVDGTAAPIYPTNSVMRGVIVPAGATKIEFTYTPFVRRRLSVVFYAAGLLLLGIGAFAFGRPPLASKHIGGATTRVKAVNE